jgi:hypothetical protein
MNDNDNIIVFLDPIGRTLFAEKVTDKKVLGKRETNKNLLVVKNPVVVHIGSVRGEDGQEKMSLQLLPVFFKEFLADKNDDVVFTYDKNNITIADSMTFDHKLYHNYKQMFSPLVIPGAEKGKKIIDLFDEKK